MPEVLAGGVRFNTMTLGQAGPVVVMIHGLLIDNHASFYMTLAPAVAKRARVVLYDLRGHGRSEQPPSGYTVDDLAGDLAGILDGLGLGGEAAILVGHSFGGHLALRFATLYPERVRGLVLLESHSGMSELGEQMAETLLLKGEARLDKVKELFGNWLAQHTARGHADIGDLDLDALDLEAMDKDGRATVERLSRLPRRRKSSMVTTARALRDQTTFVQDLLASPPLDDAALAAIACPVLAVYGADSALRTDGERLARILPDCRLEILEDCGHGVLFHGTAQVRGLLGTWLDEVAP